MRYKGRWVLILFLLCSFSNNKSIHTNRFIYFIIIANDASLLPYNFESITINIFTDFPFSMESEVVAMVVVGIIIISSFFLHIHKIGVNLKVMRSGSARLLPTTMDLVKQINIFHLHFIIVNHKKIDKEHELQYILSFFRCPYGRKYR